MQSRKCSKCASRLAEVYSTCLGAVVWISGYVPWTVLVVSTFCGNCCSGSKHISHHQDYHELESEFIIIIIIIIVVVVVIIVVVVVVVVVIIIISYKSRLGFAGLPSWLFWDPCLTLKNQVWTHAWRMIHKVCLLQIQYVHCIFYLVTYLYVGK